MYATTSREQIDRTVQTALQRRDFLMRRSVEIGDEAMYVDRRGMPRMRKGKMGAAVRERMDRLNLIEHKLHNDLDESDKRLVYETSVARREARRVRMSGQQDH